VGRLSEENGAADLLELARRSAARPPVERRWRLSVAGSGPLAAEVERLERELPPGIITYLGAPADPSRLYASAAALILPSSNVGMTSLVFGAFSWAVPAVAYDSPAVREIVADGRNGLLVSRADGAVGLERALDRLLGDPAACVRLGWAARADYEATHRGESFIDETIGLLERAGRRAARAGAQRARSATHAGGYEPTVGYLELKRTRAPVTR
jgi:glycosyltransferase involved in cell wall biosynthesis